MYGHRDLIASTRGSLSVRDLQARVGFQPYRWMGLWCDDWRLEKTWFVFLQGHFFYCTANVREPVVTWAKTERIFLLRDRSRLYFDRKPTLFASLLRIFFRFVLWGWYSNQWRLAFTDWHKLLFSHKRVNLLKEIFRQRWLMLLHERVLPHQIDPLFVWLSRHLRLRCLLRILLLLRFKLLRWFEVLLKCSVVDLGLSCHARPLVGRNSAVEAFTWKVCLEV